MKTDSGNTLFHLIAIIIVAVWGLTFISTKTLLLTGLTPEEIFVVRFSIAYAGLWILQAGRHPELFCRSFRDEMLLVIAGVTGGSLYFWAENTALEYTMTSNVSFIVCTTPLVTALLYSAVKKEKLGKWMLSGSVMALLGIAMIAFSGADEFRLGLLGDVLAMVASFTWAVYTIVTNGMLERYPSMMVSRKVFFYGVLTMIPVIAVKGWTFPLSGFLEAKVLLNIVFLSVVASLGCYATWNLVIKRLGAVKSSNYIYLNPLFTLLGATLILGERMAPLAAIGCLVTLAGVWVAGRNS